MTERIAALYDQELARPGSSRTPAGHWQWTWQKGVEDGRMERPADSTPAAPAGRPVARGEVIIGPNGFG